MAVSFVSPRANAVVMAVGLLAVFGAQFAWVRHTNFGRTDDWLLIDLASRGVVDFPYANRPLNLIWTLPAGLLAPYRLAAHFFMHVLYLFLSGLLVLAIGRRVLPSLPFTAWLTAAIALVWAPGDRSRLCPMAIYAGATFGALLALFLLVEAWVRQRRALLALAAIVAVVTVRSYEGTLPLLAGFPLLLAALLPARPRALWGWLLAWEGVVAALVARVVWPVVFPSGEGSYQSTGLGLDAAPSRVAARVLELFSFHLSPLVDHPLRDLALPAVPVSVAVFVLAASLVSRSSPPSGPAGRPQLWKAVVGGAAIALFGYILFAGSERTVTPVRTQFLAGPGIALLLAAGIGLLASLTPAPWRGRVSILLGAWVALVGAARTVGLQRELDRTGSFAAQRHELAEITRQAPALVPNTLVILLDQQGVFPATFTFRHAIELLYDRRATGYVWGASDFLYPARFTAAGVSYEPWPVIRGPWGSKVSFHRYDELVVVHAAPSGQLSVLVRWPDRVLPALPPGADYAPLTRIVSGEAPPAARGILAR
jgi:hypothetical protein